MQTLRSQPDQKEPCHSSRGRPDRRLLACAELSAEAPPQLPTKSPALEDLADRMSMSVRNLARVFTREVGTTPSKCASDARGGGASSARTHEERPQASGLDRWIRQRRRDEAGLRSAVGDHPAPPSRPRGAVDREN